MADIKHRGGTAIALATDVTQKYQVEALVKLAVERFGRFYQQHAVGPDSFARIVESAITQPPEVDINEILYRPTSQEV